MNKIKLTEQILLEDIKELIDNIISNPNHTILKLLLDLPQTLKDKINQIDIPDNTKKYYHRIIDNPELLNEENEENQSKKSIKSDKSQKIIVKSKDNSFDILKFINSHKSEKPKINYKDEKIYNKVFPEYSSLNVKLLNSNFNNLSKKIMYY